MSILFVIPALIIIGWRHRAGHPTDDPPSNPAVATWGAMGRPVDPSDLDDDDDDYDDDDDEDGDDDDEEDDDDVIEPAGPPADITPVDPPRPGDPAT